MCSYALVYIFVHIYVHVQMACGYVHHMHAWLCVNVHMLVYGKKGDLITCTHLTTACKAGNNLASVHPSSPISSLSLSSLLHTGPYWPLPRPCGCQPCSSSGRWHTLSPRSSVFIALFPILGSFPPFHSQCKHQLLREPALPPYRCAPVLPPRQ